MRLYERIYTSAAELLEGGAGNLGVVARTRGFPHEVFQSSGGAASYTLLPGLSLEKLQLHPPRLIIGPADSNRQYLGISQIVYGGPDHTGRTRPFAHHIAIAHGDIPPNASIATVLQATLPLLRRTWDAAPTWIEPPRQLELPGTVPPHFPSPHWSQFLNAAAYQAYLTVIADWLIDYTHTHRPVLICIRQEWAGLVGELIVDVLSLLPKSVQEQILAVSHVVDNSDYVRDSALMFTYPTTPFLSHATERQDPRRPVLVDLTTEPSSTAGAYAVELRAAWRTGQLNELLAVGQQWDAWGFIGGQSAMFSKVRRLKATLAQVREPRRLIDVADTVAELSNQPQLVDQIERWCMQLLQRCESWTPPARWDALLVLHGDSRWPTQVRQQACDAIARHTAQSLPYLLDNVLPLKNCSRQCESLLDAMIRTDATAVDGVLSAKLRGGSEDELAAARIIIARISDCNSLLLHLRTVAVLPDTISQQLWRLLLERFKVQVRHITQIADLCAVTTELSLRRLAEDVCHMVLKPHLSASKKSEPFNRIAQLTFDLSHRFGMIGETLPWVLSSPQRGFLKSTHIEAWIASTENSVSSQLVREQLAKAGLLPNPAQSIPSPPEGFPEFLPTSRHDINHKRFSIPRRTAGSVRGLYLSSLAIAIATAALSVANAAGYLATPERLPSPLKTWMVGVGGAVSHFVFEIVASLLLAKRLRMAIVGRLFILCFLLVALALLFPYQEAAAGLRRLVDFLRAFMPEPGK